MAKKKVGLYLGVNSLGGVVQSGGKIISMARYDLSSLEEEAKVENLNEEVKWEALINKTLREIKAEGKDIHVSLADRDFIFRSFEIPLMSKKEIESALAYEIEKYIPFKVEELMSDFTYVSFPQEKKITVSFVGMRESNFQRTNEILTRLGLTPVVVEPSSLSLVRSMKSIKKFVGLKNFALLDFTENEAYLTFFYYDLPVFNRYFAIPKNEQGSIDLENFIEPVRLSFQYFQREFRSYELGKFIIVGSCEDEKLLALLKDELQTEIEVISPKDFTGKEGSCVENIKALGAAAREDFKYKFNPQFLKRTKEQLESEGMVKIIPLKTNLLAFLGIMGVIISATAFLFFNNEMVTQKNSLAQEESMVVIPDFLKNVTVPYKQESAIKKKFADAKSLKGIMESAVKVSPLLVEISRANVVIPDGIWLDSLDTSIEKGNKRIAALRGFAFLGDSTKERQAVNDFIANLKENAAIKAVFSKVNMESSEKKEIEEFTLTYFVLKLE